MSPKIVSQFKDICYSCGSELCSYCMGSGSQRVSPYEPVKPMCATCTVLAEADRRQHAEEELSKMQFRVNQLEKMIVCRECDQSYEYHSNEMGSCLFSPTKFDPVIRTHKGLLPL